MGEGSGVHVTVGVWGVGEGVVVAVSVAVASSVGEVMLPAWRKLRKTIPPPMAIRTDTKTIVIGKLSVTSGILLL